MRPQSEKAERFRELHERPGIFVIPNPWDAGSAKLLAALGFEALATTSLGYAASIGRNDGTLSREDVLANCRVIADATDLPVSVDLENCYAHEPKQAAATMRLAAEAGAVGGSIEDATGDKAKPIYDFSLAVERVAAAVEEARKLPFRFTLVARAENFLHGRPDLDDTIRRLVAAVPKPVNVVMGLADPDITLEELEAAGVRRVSVGGALARLALAAVRDAAVAMREQGSFRWVKDIMPAKELRSVFGR